MTRFKVPSAKRKQIEMRWVYKYMETIDNSVSLNRSTDQSVELESLVHQKNRGKI